MQQIKDAEASFLFQGNNILDGYAQITPPGQEGWREAPGWWFNHYDVRYVGVDAKFFSGKRKAVLMANPFCVSTLLLAKVFYSAPKPHLIHLRRTGDSMKTG